MAKRASLSTLNKRVVQNVFGLFIKDCKSVIHCTQTPHTDVLAAGDEFAAAFESRVAHFELYDGVRMLLAVEIGEEESISEPQEMCGTLQLNAREFLQPVAAQSMHADRIVRIWGPRDICVAHRDERVAAARRGEIVVLFEYVDAVDARNARASFHTEQLHIRGDTLADERSRATQRATDVSTSVGLHALRLAPLCRCVSVPPAIWPNFCQALLHPNTRAVCPSRSCGTHSTRLVTCRVGLCTRRAGRRRC